MSSSVGVDPHKAVVLAFTDPEDCVEVASLEEGVEDKFVFGLPVLSAEGAVGELHVVRSFDMGVGEGEIFIIPGVVAVFVPGSQIDDLGPVFGVFEGLLDEVVEAVVFVDDGYGLGQVLLAVPAAYYERYPVSISGLRE